jgi:hypothetical protein
LKSLTILWAFKSFDYITGFPITGVKTIAGCAKSCSVMGIPVVFADCRSSTFTSPKSVREGVSAAAANVFAESFLSVRHY